MFLCRSRELFTQADAIANTVQCTERSALPDRLDRTGLASVMTPPTRPTPVDVSCGQWTLGAWRLSDLDQRLQPSEGEPVQLDRSAYGVLRYLLLNAGEVCTTEELLAAGWPGRVVSANSVAKCISRLRRILSDADASLIRLVHGYGYRLACAVHYRPGPASVTRDSTDHDLRPGNPLPHRPEWSLEERLGRGGCGEVYRAISQAGSGPRAYKFALGEDGLRALKREVAMHRLLHEQPEASCCVLPLLDWNLEAPPFFLATRWMAAGNLTSWAENSCRLSNSSIIERLEWSIQLCKCVDALHAADIAHRDLKPENIYPVEAEDGSLRFLLGDLGAGAGMLPPGIDSLGMPIGQATRMGQAGCEDDNSPGHRYIAPEVLSGHAAGIRADVFALGVLCAQLMAGDLKMSLGPGWEERLRDPLLCADLAEAAHIDPKRRLGSAGELAERLRSLEARREEARKRQHEANELASAHAREQRLRRHWRVSSAIAGSALLALSVSIWMGLRAEAAQREAERNAARTAAVRDFFTEALLSQADPYERAGSRDLTLLDALAHATKEIDAYFEGDSDSAAEVHLAAAEIFDAWSNHDKAVEHSSRALEHLGKVEVPAGARSARLHRRLCAHARLAGRIEQAESACATAIALERALHGEASAPTRVEASKVEFEAGRCETAIAQLSALLDSQTAAPQTRWYREAFWFRGLCRAQWGEFEAAASDLSRHVELAASANASALDQAWAKADLAEVLVMAGEFERARPMLDASEAEFLASLGRTHPHSLMATYQRGRIALWSGSPAPLLYRQVIDSWEKELGPEHAWTLYAHTEWVWALAAAGQLEEAGSQLRIIIDRTLPRLGDHGQKRSFFRDAWARTALLVGDLDTAAAEIEAMQRDSAASLPDAHPRRALVHCLRGDLALAEGDLGAARGHAARCAQELSAIPENNYRRRWLRELQTRIDQADAGSVPAP